MTNIQDSWQTVSKSSADNLLLRSSKNDRAAFLSIQKWWNGLSSETFVTFSLHEQRWLLVAELAWRTLLFRFLYRSPYGDEDFLSHPAIAVSRENRPPPLVRKKLNHRAYREAVSKGGICQPSFLRWKNIAISMVNSRIKALSRVNNPTASRIELTISA